MRDKNGFQKNCTATSNVAKAHIHLEKFVAKVKGFRIFKRGLPITLKDQLDHFFTICCALTSIGPALAPLQTYSLNFIFGRTIEEFRICGRMYSNISLHYFNWYKLLSLVQKGKYRKCLEFVVHYICFSCSTSERLVLARAPLLD